MAIPLITQKSDGCLDGTSTAVTKLVECPVDDNVPALDDVLYKGHL